jgi:CheY-like chemotaxis protein
MRRQPGKGRRDVGDQFEDSLQPFAGIRIPKRLIAWRQHCPVFLTAGRILYPPETAICNFDVMLLDVMLPDRNGPEVIDIIKSNKPGLPVLMFSLCPEVPLRATNAEDWRRWLPVLREMLQIS